MDNNAQTCAALVLDAGVLPILAPPGHAPLSRADQALLVATINHHLALQGAPPYAVHNDYRPDAFVDICGGCSDTLKAAQARDVAAATRPDAPPPAWLALWQTAFGASVQAAPRGAGVTVRLRSAVVSPLLHVALVATFWVATIMVLVVVHAALHSVTTGGPRGRALPTIGGSAALLVVLLATLLITAPAAVEVAVGDGRWHVRRARWLVWRRAAIGCSGDARAFEVRACFVSRRSTLTKLP